MDRETKTNEDVRWKEGEETDHNNNNDRDLSARFVCCATSTNHNDNAIDPLKSQNIGRKPCYYPSAMYIKQM